MQIEILTSLNVKIIKKEINSRLNSVQIQKLISYLRFQSKCSFNFKGKDSAPLKSFKLTNNVH